MIKNQLTDEYIISCIKGGEIEKASLLFERHYKNIFTYFYRLTRSHAESEDLAQNVFVRVIRLKNSYKTGRPFLPWVFRIAHHVFIDHYNYKAKEKNQLEQYGRITSEGEENQTQDVNLEIFYQAFENLSVEYRELLLLNRYHGLTYKQIGESLGLNERAVKQKAFRALEKLRDECKKREDIDQY